MNKLRVATYCRVSTNHDEQESSLEAQISYYEKLIAEHDDWQLVKIYSERASGTQLNKRSEFMKMLKDCTQKDRPDPNKINQSFWEKHIGYIKDTI